MNKLLWLIATVLIFFGPIVGVYLGIHPGILPFLGIICGLAAIVRGAQPWRCRSTRALWPREGRQ